MTWIEVADSAIKIGLGALIAGWFAARNNKATLERDARKRYAERRRDLIQRAVDRLVEYEKTYRHQKAAFDNLMRVPPASREGTQQLKDFDLFDEKLRVSTEMFAEVTGILLVLGEPGVETSMDKYRVLCDEWYTKSHSSLTDEQAAVLEPIRVNIVAARREFMARLATSYKEE